MKSSFGRGRFEPNTRRPATGATLTRMTGAATEVSFRTYPTVARAYLR
jgi:hypothetical protein